MSNNILYNVVSVFVSSIVLFALYKIMIGELGLELMGVWSLVTAFTSVTRLAGISLSGGAVKYSAEIHSGRLKEEMSAVLTSSLVMGIVFSLIISIFVFFIGRYYLSTFLDLEYLGIATQVLPVSLLSFILYGIFQTVGGLPEGVGKAHIKLIVFSISNIAFLAAAYFLMKKYGLIGVAYSQVIQYVLAIVLVCVLIKTRIPGSKLIGAFKLNLSICIARYSLNLQLINVFSLLFEPTTKMFLASYSGLSVVGIYEILSRIVVHVRNMVLSSVQLIVPYFVHSDSEKSKTDLMCSARKYSTLFFSLVFCLTGALLSTMGVLFSIENLVIFTAMGAIIVASWIVNSYIAVEFFYNISQNNMRGNIWSQASVAIVNLVLCFGLGQFYGWAGVMLAWLVAQLFGTVLLLYIFSLEKKLEHGPGYIYNGIISFSILFFSVSVDYVIFSGDGGYATLFVLSTDLIIAALGMFLLSRGVIAHYVLRGLLKLRKEGFS